VAENIKQIDMKFKPMTGNVLVLQDPTVTKTESGLALPTSGHKPYTGVVVSVGNNVELQPFFKVMFAKNVGTPIEIEGVEYLILRADEILLYDTNE